MDLLWPHPYGYNGIVSKPLLTYKINYTIKWWHFISIFSDIVVVPVFFHTCSFYFNHIIVSPISVSILVSTWVGIKNHL